MKTYNQPTNGVAPSLPNTTRRGMVRSHRVSRNLLLDLPITWRLTLGFLVAALVAVTAAGITGSQREQSLSRQSDFYQNLLQINTSLNTGNTYLLLMNTKIHDMLIDASVPVPSKETLQADQSAIQGLAARYDAVAANYVQGDLLNRHPDQVSLLDEGGHASLVSQQLSLVGSMQRTWRVFRTAQDAALKDIVSGSLTDAQSLLRAQVEPTNADALSALHALIQFNQRISASVRDAAGVEEQNQIITTIVAALCAFLVIAFTGWLISKTLVQRLRQLRHVTRAVEQGQLDRRVQVVGHDEIAGVSASVNDMLDTIVGLLEETERQREALTNAAAHLFSDMRIVSAGDLRVHAPVSDDPIGLLANAFNFTVGRFNHFVLHTQTTIEQLDTLSRQQRKHIEEFKLALDSQVQTPQMTGPLSSPSIQATPRTSGPLAGANSAARSNGQHGGESASIVQTQVRRSRDQLLRVAQESAWRLRSLQDINKQAYQSSASIRQLIQSNGSLTSGYGRNYQANPSQSLVQEVQALETSLAKLDAGWQQMQDGLIKGLTGVDTMLTVLVSPSVRVSDTGPTLSSNAHETVLYSQEFTNFARSFLQEMYALTQRLIELNKEMRTSATSFRLDPASEVQRKGT
ncbi:MAG TPA: HAMP domain-containing protein [Ktedonobacteraceae bacterium]